jgi:hypothetical protein
VPFLCVFYVFLGDLVLRLLGAWGRRARPWFIILSIALVGGGFWIEMGRWQLRLIRDQSFMNGMADSEAARRAQIFIIYDNTGQLALSRPTEEDWTDRIQRALGRRDLLALWYRYDIDRTEQIKAAIDIQQTIRHLSEGVKVDTCIAEVHLLRETYPPWLGEAMEYYWRKAFDDDRDFRAWIASKIRVEVKPASGC